MVQKILLKEMLEITDGQRASNMKALEKHEFIQVRKQFIGRKPNTKYIATELGRKEFKKHINALEKILKSQRD